MNIFLYIVITSITAILFAIFCLSKCYFLASYRIGWLMLYSNLVYEVIERKLHWQRGTVDTILLLGVLAGCVSCFGAFAGAVILLLMFVVWLFAIQYENSLLKSPSFRMQKSLKGKVLLPLPDLLISVKGPILKRKKNSFDLGVWPVGLEQNFKLQILNPGPARGQIDISIEIKKDDNTDVKGIKEGNLSTPEPGALIEETFSIKAIRECKDSHIRIFIRQGDCEKILLFRIRRIVSAEATPVSVKTVGWKAGADAAFIWRGDQDLYDPATFQSEEGLRTALSLSKRYRFPSTLMLSSGLSLDEKAHREFCEHFGWDRHSEGIQGFINFLKNKVDKTAEQEWPTSPNAEFSAEIGNHMHLHYGTHAAADPGNNWKSHARMGDGKYEWTEAGSDSFTEQRDNAKKCSEMFSRILDTKPASFTIPSDVRDANTSKAMEAAGLEVGSETDATKLEKLISLKPPHHPKGCERFVELPRMHPRDPQNAAHLAMLKFWVGHAYRTGRSLVFLAHHHLSRYNDESSMKMTEQLLRYVIQYNSGGIYIGTMTAVGRYWRDVLSPKTACVKIEKKESSFLVKNTGKRTINGIPLEIKLASGGSYMRIIDLTPGESVDLM